MSWAGPKKFPRDVISRRCQAIKLTIIMALSTSNFYGTSKSSRTSESYFTRQIQTTPRGLKNAGNSCYVNSAIQTLFSFNIFMNTLKEYYESFSNHILATKKESLNEFPILSRLIKLYDIYKNSSKSIYELNDNMIEFKTFFGSQCDKRFQTRFKDSWIQQDAAEFLSFTLQFIEEEISNNKPVYKFNKVSPVDQHFQSMLVHQDKCNRCGQVSKLITECANTFHLQLTSDRTLQSAFIKLIEKEETTNKCSSCSGSQTKEKLFEKLPKVLTFQPVRYNESYGKDSEKIYANPVIYLPRSYFLEPKKEPSSPLPPLCKPSPKRSMRLKEIVNKKLKGSESPKANGELKENTPNNHPPSLNKSTSDPLSENQKANSGVSSTARINCERFQLVSVICHYGPKTSFGHYKSYVFKQSKWFRCDDCYVAEVEVDKLFEDVSTHGFCYFYVHLSEDGVNDVIM